MLNHNYGFKRNCNSIIKVSVYIFVMGLNTNINERKGGSLMSSLGGYNLSLNVSKTTVMMVDFRKSYTALHIDCAAVRTASNFSSFDRQMMISMKVNTIIINITCLMFNWFPDVTV